MTKIAFITEGGLKMGMGHVVRSITLAEELKDSAEICFLTQSDEIVVNKIKNAEFDAFKLQNDHHIVNRLKDLNPNVVIIDKLNVDEDLVVELKDSLNTKLVIFGNLSKANKYADVVVNAVIGSKLKNKKFSDKSTNTIYFCGPRYYVLRKEFYEFKKKGKRLSGKTEKILLIFGGSDPSNLTSKVLNELLHFNADLKIDIILGVHFVYFDELNQVLGKYQTKKKNVRLYRNIKNVAELMYKADLVIVSPGVSMFEALCVSTPVIAIYQNPLQESWFDGSIHIFDKTEINKIKDAISNGDFLNPGEDYIKELDIGGGKTEIISAIIHGGE